MAVTVLLGTVLGVNQIVRDIAADDARHAANGMMRIHLVDPSADTFRPPPGD